MFRFFKRILTLIFLLAIGYLLWTGPTQGAGLTAPGPWHQAPSACSGPNLCP